MLYISHFLYGDDVSILQLNEHLKVRFCDLGFAENGADLFHRLVNESDIYKPLHKFRGVSEALAHRKVHVFGCADSENNNFPV